MLKYFCFLTSTMVIKCYAKSIQEFKHAAKGIEDKLVTIEPYLLSAGNTINLCLRLESDSVVYERMLDRKMLPRLTDLKEKTYYLEAAVKLLERDLIDQGFFVKTEKIKEKDQKLPRMMSDEDYAYLFGLICERK